MKIVLHGAINGTNFGDCLFAGLFYDRLARVFGKDSTFFFDVKPFGIGEHLRDGLRYKGKLKLSDYRYIDALVYISGGYFGDNNKSIKGSIIRYLRYLSLGLFAIKHGIKIYVIGLEIGPIHHRFVKNAIKKILSNAELVIVRNKDSLEYAKGLTMKKIVCTADTAISVTKKDFAGKEAESTADLLNQIDRKIIFLHMLPLESVDVFFAEKILQPIIRFIKIHDDYCVVYGTDGGKRTRDFTLLKNEFSKNDILVFEHIYSDWYDMCYFLSRVDVIITRKLHVGIIGSRFGKSVISTPIHLYKTLRFYKQIGEEGRCVQYSILKDETVYNLLTFYANKKIKIPENIVSLSSQNIDLLVYALKKEDYNEIKHKKKLSV